MASKSDEDAMKKLLEQLETNNPAVTTICGYRSLDEGKGQEIAKRLAHNTHVAYLELPSSQLQVSFAQALSLSLHTNTTLTTISLPLNPLGPEGAKIVAEGVGVNGVVLSLNVAGCNVGVAGMHAFGNMLRMNTSLEELDISSNPVGPEGIRELCQGLKTNNTLTYLILFENKMGPEGAAILCDTVKDSKSLNVLGISRNDIGPHGAEAVGGMLRVNTSLSSLFMNSNKITAEGVLHLVTAMFDNKNLMFLTWDQSLDQDGDSALNTRIAENKKTLLELTPWLPNTTRHRSFGQKCHVLLRTVAMAILRLQRRPPVREDGSEPVPLPFVDPAVLEMAFESLRRKDFVVVQ